MSAIGDYLRAEMRLASKYRLRIIDGDSPPRAVHADGWTQWKGHRPVKYTRATNDLQVGREWLHRTFAATYALSRLTGQEITSVALGDHLNRQWLLAQTDRPTAAQAWATIEARKQSSRSADPENERLYA